MSNEKDIGRDLLPGNNKREPQSFSNDLINILPGVFSIISQEGKFLLWNSKFESAFGYSADEIKTLSPLDFFEEANHALIAERIEESFKTGYTEVEVETLTKSGQKIYYLFTSNSIQYLGQKCIANIGIDISASKQTKQKLEFSEATFKGAFEQNAIGMALLSLDKKWIEVNPGFCSFLGYSKDELLALALADISRDDEIQDNISNLNKLISGEIEIYNTEKEYLHKDGHWKWGWLIVSIVRNSAGEPLNFVAHIADITSQKETQERIIESEAFNKAILNSLNSHIAVIDSAGTIVAVNDGWRQFAHENGDTLLQSTTEGTNYFSVCEKSANAGDETAGIVLQGLKDTLEGKTESFYFEYPCHSPIEVRWFGMRATKFESNKQMLVISHLNITERKQIEENLREREGQFRLFIEHSPVSLAMLDTNMCYIAVSKSWKRDFGFEDVDVVGKSHYDIFPEIPYHWRKVHQRCLAGASEKNDDEAFVRQDGSIDWLRWEVTPWYKADNVVGGIIIFSESITERKEVELKFRNLVEKSLVGVYIIQDDKIVYTNPKYADIYGYTPDELIGKSPYDLVPEEDREIVLQKIRQREVGEVDTVHYEVGGLRKDGKHIWIEAYGTITQYKGKRAILGSLIDITPRHHAAAALDASLKELSNYKIALDESSIVAITDEKGVIKYANDNFCNISKFSRKELIGQKHSIVKSDYHPKEFFDDMWNTIGNGKVWRGEVQNKAKDGSVYWVNTTIVPFLNEKGKPWQYVAIRYDITNRKNAEAALQNSLKELSDYKIALDESSIVAITDQKGIIKFANDNFCKISKFTRVELIGQDHRIINSGYHSKEFIKNIWVTIANGKIWRGDICNKAKDGTTYWVETTIVPFINDEGKPWQYVAIRSDITDRKTAEQALLNSEANLKTIFDTSDTAYTLLDIDFKVVSFNNEASKFALHELSWDGEVGDYLPDYFLPGKKHVIEKALYDAKDGEHINYESSYSQADGTVNWYHVKLYPVADFDAKVLGIMVAINNITERKIAELQRESMTADLIQRNKDLEQFTYIVSHNLRAPVANIIGFADELKIDSNTEEEKVMYVKELAESVNKLDGVIKDLNHILQVKREVSESKEFVSFSGTLRNIEVSISNMIKAEGVEIRAEFGAVDEMNTLKSYLYSIFYNLITNSIKYRRPTVPPVIEITSHKTETGITLIFKDNGMGIDLDKKGDQVFGLYKRFHTQMAEGKGMGLFMTKTQVETIGGKISINSKVDVGTEFILEFTT